MNFYKFSIGKQRYKLVKLFLYVFLTINLLANAYYYLRSIHVKPLRIEYKEYVQNLKFNTTVDKEIDETDLEKIERKIIIDKFLNDYLNNVNDHPKFDKEKLKTLLYDYMSYEDEEIEKLIEIKKPNKTVQDTKVAIHLPYENVYRIDTTCYWHKIVDPIPKYKFKYTRHDDKWPAKYCSINKNLKSIKNTSYIMYKLESLIESNKIKIQDNVFLNELPVEPLIDGGAWFPKFDYLRYLKENSFKKKSIFEYSTKKPCISKERIAIIIPIKNREQNLNVFLTYIHFFLQSQSKSYKIYTVEQITDENDKIPFNKGRLYNTAFQHIIKDREWQFNCIILHDVDLLPINLDLDYSCADMPKHMSIDIVRLKDKSISPHYKFLTGGVLALRPQHYETLNGYSNEYFGWGGEDDDFTIRIIEKQLCVMRPFKNISNYVMLKHASNGSNMARWELMVTATQRIDYDGLSNVHKLTEIKSITEYFKFTRILVDVLKLKFI